jgi:hypothetical protein
MSKARWIGLTTALLLLGVATAFVVRGSALGRASTWQRLASPGPLSAGHAFLEDNCAACHTPGRGPEAASCIACHADNEWLLQRQPTAFHASAGSCRECHPEHQGAGGRPTAMDHAALARVGLRRLREDTSGSTAAEGGLNCAACHATKDRHFTLFGQDCAQCHSTEKWTVEGFRHPSSRSTDCAQCHQAPPSHYMGHFHMVSMKVAGKPHARVNECHLCHETTAWNDIKGVGWYKHH